MMMGLARAFDAFADLDHVGENALTRSIPAFWSLGVGGWVSVNQSIGWR
jgi:hypothetical protein